MYLAIDDKVIEAKQKEVEDKNQLLIDEANSLSWIERNFTNKYDLLRDELIDNWKVFQMWQDNHLRLIRNKV